MAISQNQKSPLLQVADKYKLVQKESHPFLADMLHYHEKNPEGDLQIKLLEEADKVICNISNIQDQAIAQLGLLLMLRDLLIDPNRDQKIYSYLIEKLDIDTQIKAVLKKISPEVNFDLADDKFLKLGKRALNIGHGIIESSQIKAALPMDFLQDIAETVLAENDYTDKVVNAIEVSRLK